MLPVVTIMSMLLTWSMGNRKLPFLDTLTSFIPCHKCRTHLFCHYLISAKFIIWIFLSFFIRGNQLATGSEDGTVRIWDTRKPKAVHTIIPHSDHKLSRPKLGKWIGAVAMNDDWLVKCLFVSFIMLFNYCSFPILVTADDRKILDSFKRIY